jgi:hypothetical protein
MVLRDDARAAIRALIELVNRDPFALGPLEVAFDERELSAGVHPHQFRLFEPQDPKAAVAVGETMRESQTGLS